VRDRRVPVQLRLDPEACTWAGDTTIATRARVPTAANFAKLACTKKNSARAAKGIADDTGKPVGVTKRGVGGG
jgi:hypothetical protein